MTCKPSGKVLLSKSTLSDIVQPDPRQCDFTLPDSYIAEPYCCWLKQSVINSMVDEQTTPIILAAALCLQYHLQQGRGYRRLSVTAAIEVGLSGPRKMSNSGDVSLSLLSVAERHEGLCVSMLTSTSIDLAPLRLGCFFNIFPCWQWQPALVTTRIITSIQETPDSKEPPSVKGMLTTSKHCKSILWLFGKPI